MGVSSQGYYDWRKHCPSRTTLRHEFLKSEIKQVFYEHKGRYGSPRIAQQLYDERIEMNKRVVAVLMRELTLCAKGFHRRKPSYGKEKAIEQVIKENLLYRQFNQSQIDAIWVTDITYISCAYGRFYLSTSIDLATRIPRCYKGDTHMRKEIVIQPLERYKGSLPAVVHSDRGSLYRSHNYQELLREKPMTHSMSHPGTPVDHAVIESFHRSIKRECKIFCVSSKMG